MLCPGAMHFPSALHLNNKIPNPYEESANAYLCQARASSSTLVVTGNITVGVGVAVVVFCVESLIIKTMFGIVAKRDANLHH
jgi:hypothetical protein